MKRTILIFSAILLILLIMATVLPAQDANPISSNLNQSWKNIGALITKMAEKMPDDNYRFKPTPEIQDFGQRMAHIIGANMRTCASLKGEQKPLTFGQAPTKAEIAAAMKQMNEECDSAFASLDDAGAMKTMQGRGGVRTRLAIAEGMLEHSQEVYGYMCVYLRLKGIVPPSSDRNER